MGRKPRVSRGDLRKSLSRRVQKLGSTSLVITLPKSWALRFNVKPGDKLTVVDEGYQLRVIPPRNANSVSPQIRMRSNVDIQLINSVLLCLYTQGFGSITLKNSISVEDEEVVKQITRLSQNILVSEVEQTADGYRLVFVDSGEEDPLIHARKYMSDLYTILEKISEIKHPSESQLIELVENLDNLRLTALKINRARLFGSNSKGLCENLPFTLSQVATVMKKLVIDASRDENTWRVLSTNAEKLKTLSQEIIAGLIYSSWKRLDSGLKMLREMKKELIAMNNISQLEARIVGRIESLLDLLEIVAEVCACNVVLMGLISGQQE